MPLSLCRLAIEINCCNTDFFEFVRGENDCRLWTQKNFGLISAVKNVQMEGNDLLEIKQGIVAQLDLPLREGRS